jgi:peroxiredoxin
LQIVGVSYDSVEVLAKFATQSKITYPLLSDPDSKAITAYDVLNKEAKGKLAGIPYPATMLLDAEGVVRGKLIPEGYKDRHSTEALVRAAKEIK